MKRKEIAALKQTAPRRAMVKYACWVAVAMLVITALGRYFFWNLRNLFSLLSLIPFPLLWLLMLLFPDDVTLEDKDSKATRGKIKVILPLIASALYPWLRHLLDQEILEPVEIAWKVLPLFVVMLVVTLLKNEECREKLWKLVMVILLLTIFSAAFVGIVNVCLDSNPQEQISTQVLDKRMSSSSKGRRYYYLDVPFGNDELSFSVDKNLYSQYKIGDEVTINVGSGALGIAYARIAQ